MRIPVADRQRRLPPCTRILQAMARRVVREEDPGVDEVGIVLADDALLEALNGAYRGKPKPTDVLAFPSEGVGPYRLLGEVIISTDRAVLQAPRYHHPVADEMVRLLVHGLLHLLGHEHDTAAGRRRMRRAEAVHIEAMGPWVKKLRARYRTRGRP